MAEYSKQRPASLTSGHNSQPNGGAHLTVEQELQEVLESEPSFKSITAESPAETRTPSLTSSLASLRSGGAHSTVEPPFESMTAESPAQTASPRSGGAHSTVDPSFESMTAESPAQTRTPGSASSLGSPPSGGAHSSAEQVRQDVLKLGKLPKERKRPRTEAEVAETKLAKRIRKHHLKEEAQELVKRFKSRRDTADSASCTSPKESTSRNAASPVY